ncbi:MAG: hypothetical protein HY895_16770 [Deltaproteobacteria bacterium]|nr:hypothetical protein [Deltaproteobacteria bacterium]
MEFWGWFLIGFFAGGIFGMVVGCALGGSRRTDAGAAFESDGGLDEFYRWVCEERSKPGDG